MFFLFIYFRQFTQFLLQFSYALCRSEKQLWHSRFELYGWTVTKYPYFFSLGRLFPLYRDNSILLFDLFTLFLSLKSFLLWPRDNFSLPGCDSCHILSLSSSILLLRDNLNLPTVWPLSLLSLTSGTLPVRDNLPLPHSCSFSILSLCSSTLPVRDNL